ncbi:MAG TPA: hypothetical protein VFW40_13085 [Capsulimonadaceae bacterium]|nr:hypothetical protein [Capsulimonadaceae bacterium]
MFIFRIAVAIAALFLLAACAFGQVPPGKRLPLGLNVDFNEQSLIDLIQPTSRIDGATGQDALGWPTSDFRFILDNRYVFAWVPGAVNIDPKKYSTDLSGVYKLSFQGQAVVSAASDDPLHGGVTVSNQLYDPKTNTTTADVNVGNPPGGVLIVLSFSQTKRQATGASGTGVTDLHLIRPGYVGREKQVFTDVWLDSIRKYPWSALRFMGALGTNDYADWGSHEAYPYRLKWPTDRALPEAGPLYGKDHVGVHGIPWEYVVFAANETGKDIWINIPVNASDDYVTQLARLLHDGDSFTGNKGIKPGLNIYVEYSNEMWHYGFFQGAWNFTAGKDEVQAGGSNLDYDHIGNNDVWRFRRMAKRTIEIGKLFRAVFTNDPARIRPVIDNAFIEHDVDLLDYVTKNYGPPVRFLYAIAQTGYYGSKDKTSVGAILTGEKAASDQNRVGYERSRAIATYYGLHSLAYEGGQDEEGNKQPITPADTTLANQFAAARDPGMADVEMHDLIGNWFPAGGDLYMQFAHADRYSTYGMWGLSDDLTHRDSGKWVGVSKVMRAPAPAVTAGTLIAATDGANIAPSPDSLGSGFDYPRAGQSGFFLLRAAKAGEYTVALTTKAAGDSSSQVQMFLDNQLVGGPVTCPPSAATDLGRVKLPAGLCTLRLVVVKGAPQPERLTVAPENR